MHSGFSMVVLATIFISANAQSRQSEKPVVAQCPATLPPTASIAPKFRVIGSFKQPNAQLVYATVADEAPNTVQDDGAIAEKEPDDSGGVNHRTGMFNLSTYFNSIGQPQTLVCYYGSYGVKPGTSSALLLSLLPSNVEGECTLTRKPGRPKVWAKYPTTMICRRS